MTEADRPPAPSGQAEDTVQSLLLRLGQRLRQDGRDKEARDALLSATREAGEPPVAAAAWLALADLELGQGSLAQGAQALADALVADPAHPSAALARISGELAGGAGPEDTTAEADPAQEADRQAVSRAVAGELTGRGPALIELPGFPLDGVMLLIEAPLRLGQVDHAADFVKLVIASQGPRIGADIRERIQAGALDAATDDPVLALLSRARLLAACDADRDAIAAADAAVDRSAGARNTDVEAPALELKAQLLDEAGDTAGAARAWFEAGKRWVWGGQFATALPAIDRAHGVCDDPELPFYRAESLRIQESSAGEAHRTQLTAALQAWDEGKSARKIVSWALLTRALINDKLAIYGDDPTARRWAAILDCERAIAVRPYDEEDAWDRTPDPASLAEAGSLYWSLNYRATAVWSALDAWRRQPDDPLVLSATTFVVVNAGLSDPPENLIRAVGEEGSGRGQGNTNAWFRGVAGILAKNSGDLDTADAYLTEAVDADPSLVWAYGYLYTVLAQKQHWEKADGVLSRMLERTDPDAMEPELDTPVRRAFGLLLAGRPGEVLEQQDLLVANADALDGDVEWMLATAYALQGDMTSFRTWAERGKSRIAGTSSSTIRDMGGSLRAVAAALVHREGPSGQAIADALIQEAASLETDAVKRAAGEFGPDAALRELAAAQQTAAPRGPAWVAARLMRARIMLVQQEDHAAAEFLSEIAPVSEFTQGDASDAVTSVFPEAGLAAATAFSHAAVSAAFRERPDEAADYLRRGASASAHAGHSVALASLRGLARSPLLDELSEPGQFVALSQSLAAFSRLPQWSRDERVKIGISCRQIHRRCYARAFSGIVSGGAEENSALRTPLAGFPIVIEADPALFPQMGETPGVRWMLSTGIPAMKDRLGQDRAPLPGVRIRPADDLSEGNYRFLVLGELAATGTVRLGAWFCRDPGRARLLDPLATMAAGPDGRPGAWCALPAGPASAGADDGAESGLLDPFAFILAHLTGVLRGRRAALLSRSMFCELLDAAAARSGYRAPSPAEASAALAVMRQVLALGADPPDPALLVAHIVRDGKGPADLAPGLAAVMQPASAGPDALPLDSEIERRLTRGLTTADGKAAVVLPGDEAAALQDSFDAWLAESFADGSAVTVLIRSPQLLLAAGTLAIRSRRRCAVGLLAADGDA